VQFGWISIDASSNKILAPFSPGFAGEKGWG
jgi:hypothetical protein